ncbi:hypothetical protein [Actinokineospora inagensis]|uniref:hypothetical protein n=1 Tax=Actinokineospora inagensis TaxID=103730 RepID=UPI0004191D69|nr:hypothetical protein [Actinokineospora inagensis]
MTQGATPEITELAAYLSALTAGVTARDLSDRFGTGTSLWGRYRSGERIVPWHLLEQVVADSVADRRGRLFALTRAKDLYNRAEAAAARAELG